MSKNNSALTADHHATVKAAHLNDTKRAEHGSSSTRAHLEALGIVEGDRVYYSGFYPATDPRARSDKGRKASAVYPAIPSDLRQWESDGRGVYVVVNSGGHKIADITACRAWFYEHDDIGKDISAGLWEPLGLPKPTFWVDTGGKSQHSYFVSTEHVEPAPYRQLQTELLDYADADRSLKNQNRVMRLAGFKHAGTGVEARFIPGSGQRYSFDVMRAAVPAKQSTKPTQTTAPTRGNSATTTDWAKLGHAEKVDLAKELLPFIPRRQPGTGTYDDTYPVLAALTHEFDLSTALMLARYWSPDEDWGENLDRKISSFKGSANPVTMKTIFKMARDNGWKPVTLSRRDTLSRAPRDSQNVDSASDRERLSRCHAVTPEESLVTDWEWQNLESISNRQCFNPLELLPAPLRDRGNKRAQDIGADPTAIFAGITAAVPSFMGIDAQIALGATPNTGWIEPATVWNIMVGSSGCGKSPAISSVVAPLKKFQESANAEYERASDEYQSYLDRKAANKGKGDSDDIPEIKEPRRQRLLYNRGTIEGFDDSMRHQERGALMVRDELPSLFKSMNQYKGSGNDLEWLLSLWNGEGEDNTLKREDSVGYKNRLSIVGGIQPDLAPQFVGNDSQGVSARFLWWRLYRQTYKYSDSPNTLTPHLEDLYRFVEGVEWGTVCLHPDAIPYWASIAESMRNAIAPVKAAESYMAKLTGNVARLALSLHAIDCFYHQDPTRYKQVSETTLKRAYELGQLSLRHFLSLIALNDDNDGLSSIIQSFQEKALKITSNNQGKGVSLRDLSRVRQATLKKFAQDEGLTTADFVKRVVKEMAARGLGKIEVISDESILYVPYKQSEQKYQVPEELKHSDPRDRRDSVTDTPQSVDMQGVEGVTPPRDSAVTVAENVTAPPFEVGDVVEFSYPGSDKTDISTALHAGSAPKGTRGFVSEVTLKDDPLAGEHYWSLSVTDPDSDKVYRALPFDLTPVAEWESF